MARREPNDSWGRDCASRNKLRIRGSQGGPWSACADHLGREVLGDGVSIISARVRSRPAASVTITRYRSGATTLPGGCHRSAGRRVHPIAVNAATTGCVYVSAHSGVMRLRFNFGGSASMGSIRQVWPDHSKNRVTGTRLGTKGSRSSSP